MLYIARDAEIWAKTLCTTRESLMEIETLSDGWLSKEPGGRGEARPLAHYRFYGLDMKAWISFHSCCRKIAVSIWGLEEGERSWNKTGSSSFVQLQDSFFRITEGWRDLGYSGVSESCLTARVGGNSETRTSLEPPEERQACHTNGSCKLVPAGSCLQPNTGQLSTWECSYEPSACLHAEPAATSGTAKVLSFLDDAQPILFLGSKPFQQLIAQKSPALGKCLNKN